MSPPATAPLPAPVPVSPELDRLVARRFAGGHTPALAADIAAAGGGRAWFTQQLDPAAVADPAGDDVDTWFARLRRTPKENLDLQRAETDYCWQTVADLSRWTVARRLASRRQLQETMTDFWSNLLHVALMDDAAMFWRVDYDQTVRRLALTSFEELLTAAVTHPAMGLYLDNATSTRKAPNENLGRELLELHTVGVGSGYTEADVRNSARLLTGYRVDTWWPAFQAFYDPARHWTGAVSVLGFTHANAAADGRPAATAYLSYLARHEATARRLARRLCVRFVRDDPSDDLVATVARAYLDAGTAIRPTLLALIDHPEFAASAGRKVRTPIEDWVASVRALGIALQAPVDDDSYARSSFWQYRNLGQPPYETPSPNGSPEDNASQCTAGRLLNSFAMHRGLAAQWWLMPQSTRPELADWLPPLPARLDTVIDHVGTRVLGEPPAVELRAGIAQVFGWPLDHVVTEREAAQYWPVRTVLAALLDSPQHLTR